MVWKESGQLLLILIISLAENICFMVDSIRFSEQLERFVNTIIKVGRAEPIAFLLAKRFERNLKLYNSSIFTEKIISDTQIEVDKHVC